MGKCLDAPTPTLDHIVARQESACAEMNLGRTIRLAIHTVANPPRRTPRSFQIPCPPRCRSTRYQHLPPSTPVDSPL